MCKNRHIYYHLRLHWSHTCFTLISSKVISKFVKNESFVSKIKDILGSYSRNDGNNDRGAPENQAVMNMSENCQRNIYSEGCYITVADS